MIATEYHSDLNEVQCDVALSALLSPAEAAAPFDRLAWWQTLAEHCGLDPLLAVAREGDAIAVLPLARVDFGLQGLANWYTFRLRPVVSDRSQAPALLAAIAASLADKTDRIALSNLPDEDNTATILEAAFRDTGWLVLCNQTDSNHVLPVAGRSFEQYRSSLPGRLRATLKRKAKKVDCEIVTRFDPDLWATYEDIYAASWKPNEGSPAFLRAFAEAEGAAGRLRLGVARMNGEALAAQLWTVEGGIAFIHKLAHREAARPFSPGTVLTAALFRHVIDKDRVDQVDFGTGDDPYKRDWMEDVRPRYSLTCLRRSNPRAWLTYGKFRLARLARRAARS